MADRFYTNQPLTLGPLQLEGPEGRHLATVRRFLPGDTVYLFNGDGRQYAALVRGVSRQGVELEIVAAESRARELDYRLEVAAPLPKGDRAQFLVEKLTELGATSFTPLRTQRSVVHPRESRRDKLQRYVIEASKQCGRNVLLQVEPLTDWQTYCKRNDLPLIRILAHLGEAAEGWPAARDTAVAVGPEGGFTEEELSFARGLGWRAVSLGARILRVETAALVLATLAANPLGAKGACDSRVSSQ
jgi:16S rRNA (uracil1498-N3)-methyltransferase